MITLASVTCRNLSTNRLFTDGNIVGNVGEKVRLTFEFTSPDISLITTQYASAYLQYVLKPKDAPPYAVGAQTLIPNAFFQNLHSSGVAQIVTNNLVSSLNNQLTVDLSGQLVSDTSQFTMTILNPTTVEVVVDLYILPALRTNDFAGGVFSVPTYFSGINCLTGYFQFGVNEPGDGINPPYIDDTRDFDLSVFFSSGNVGYFKEAYNFGSEYFALSSFTSPPSFDPTLNQNFAAVIERTVAASSAPAIPYAANTKVQVMILRLKDGTGWDATKTYMQNTEFVVLETLANNTPTSNAKISNFKANIISATELDIDFTINANALQGGAEYAVWLNVGAENADGIWITQNTAPQLLFGEQGSSLENITATINFSHWDREPASPNFTGLRSFRSDDGLAFCQITNGNTTLNVFNSFQFGFKYKSTGVPLAGELFTVNVSDLPYNVSRGRVRAVGNLYNKATVEQIALGVYQINYGFQAWDGWADSSDIVFFVRANVTSNGISDFVEFQSPNIETGQFFTTKNSAIEPQALPLTPQAVEFFVCDSLGNITIPTAFDRPVYGENHVIVATWKDNNLNDLQTSDVIGYLGVCADSQKTNKNVWRYFFSLRDAEADTPFKAVLGHTAGRAKAEVIAIDTAQVSAILIWSDYERIFGTEKPCFDFRLDRQDPPVPVYATQKYITFHLRNNQFYASYELTEPIGYIVSFTFNGFFGVPPAGTNFYINGILYPFAVWLNNLAGLVPGDLLEIEAGTPSTALPYGTDWTFNILVGTFSAVAAGFKQFTIPLRNADLSEPQVGCDAILSFDTEVEFDTNVANNDALYVGFRDTSATTGESYVTFPYFLKDAVSVAALNAAIAGKTKTNLHFCGLIAKTSTAKFPNAGWQPLATDTVTARNMRFSYRFPLFDDTREILGYGGEATNPRYATALQNNGAFYNGASRYEAIGGVPNTFFVKGAKFVCHCEFDTTFAGGGTDRVIWAAGISGSAGGFATLRQEPNLSMALNFSTNTFVLSYFFPPKFRYNTVSIYYNGGNLTDPNSFAFVINGVNITPSQSLIGTEPVSFSVQINGNPNNFLIGCNTTANRFWLGRLRKLNFWTGANLVLPTDFELRCLQNVHDNNAGAFQGESYDPIASSDFYAFFDFNKTGVNPISVTSNLALSVTQFGAISYNTYLNP